MKKYSMILFALLAVALLAPAAFAQTGAGGAGGSDQLGGHHFGLCHGDCFGGLRHRAGARDVFGLRRHGSQSGRGRRPIRFALFWRWC